MKKEALFVKENIKHEQKTPGQKKGHKAYFRKIPERIDELFRFTQDKNGHR